MTIQRVVKVHRVLAKHPDGVAVLEGVSVGTSVKAYALKQQASFVAMFAELDAQDFADWNNLVYAHKLCATNLAAAMLEPTR